MRKSWLVRHASAYFAAILHYPTGADLRFQTMAPFNGLVTLPVQLVFGLLPAYNTAVLFSFVIGGFGAYLLALYALRGIANRASKPSAISHSAFPQFRIHHSSFIVPHFLLRLHCRPDLRLFPLHFAHLLGHLQLIALQWIPFYVLYLLRGWTAPHPPPSALHTPPALTTLRSSTASKPASFSSWSDCAIGIMSCIVCSSPAWRC